jgi:hypothetical protein
LHQNTGLFYIRRTEFHLKVTNVLVVHYHHALRLSSVSVTEFILTDSQMGVYLDVLEYPVD